MPQDLIGKEILGQFRILERIGRGGMGEVFKAEQPAMDRMVAIKILHEKLAARPDLVSRFRREARAMSRLSHPNTVRVFLYGQLENTGQLYIAMEYLEGMDLARNTRRDGPMDAVRGSKIIIQVLGALEEAHGVGVIHRDLKPENILLTTQGGIADFPKVLDFGLAKIKEQNPRPGSLVLTREGMVFGTPEFMSPEQARGETLDGRSDVYSMGVIFYEMLTARLPFPRCKPMEYISHHINTPPIPVTERRPELDMPKELDPIMAKALEKERESRYASAKDFAEALQAVIPRKARSGPMHAIPSASRGDPTEPQRISSPAPPPRDEPGRGKGLVIALLVVIAALLIAVIFLLASNEAEDPAVVPLQPPGQPVPTAPPPPAPQR
ncbi:MAG: protein kinase [Deltaproteobacteria bacterium]|nr:protein kinase [Deltaproteobacteria bacterium]